MKDFSPRLFAIGAIVQLLVAVGHLVGHFSMPRPANETEQKLISMMSSYQKEVAGGKMSILESYDGLNITYALFFLFAGAVNYYIFRKQRVLIRPFSLFTAAATGIGTVIAIIYFFWIPVVYFAVCFTAFGAAFLLSRENR